MTTVERRRSELGAFLRARRGRVRPEDVGLPPGVRRRTTGLRREEVALLAGVGVTWYTWLGQGRPINASGQVLDAVARTLRMGDTERWHLYRLAEATPVRWHTSEAVPETVHAVLSALQPSPAVVVNGRFDVLASNDSYEHLFWDWHSMPCVHRNPLWCCVTEPNARTRLRNYDDEVAYMVARTRAEYARHVGEADWEEDIRRLLELSDDFARLWVRQEVAAPSVHTRHYRMPRYGDITFAVSELTVAESPNMRVQVHTPVDDGARAALANLGIPGSS